MAAPFRATSVPLGRVVERISRGGQTNYSPGQLLPLEDRDRARHVFIWGRSGYGKTRFTYSLIAADIERGEAAPFILIDGVGACYEDILSMLGAKLLALDLAARRAPRAIRRRLELEMERFARRFVFLDATREDPLCRINVLALAGLKPEEMRSAFIGGCVRFADIDPAQTRQLLQVISAIFTVLVGLPNSILADALDALGFNVDQWDALLGYLERRRLELSNGAPTRTPPSIQFLQDLFLALTPANRQLIARSTYNMINAWLGNARIAKLFSSPETTLDMSAIANGEKCLLVKLPPGQDTLTQPLFGGLLVDLTMLYASKRDLQAVATGKVPRVTLYIDEVAAFAGKAFAQDLARCRNFGVAVVATAQHFRQSPWHTPDGSALLQSLRGNMSTTVLFRTSLDMALVEAEYLFRPQGDKVARQEEEFTETNGYSEAHGTSASSTTSRTLSSNSSESRGNTHGSSDGVSSPWMGQGGTNSFGQSQSASEQSSTSEGVSDAHGSSEGTSYQQSHTKSRSVRMRRDYYSIDDETRLAAQTIASLPAREPLVVLANDTADVYRVRTLDVPTEWQTVWGAKDYKEEFYRLAAPPLPAPEPTESLDLRVRKLIEEERRSRRGQPFIPRVVAGGGRR